MEGNELTRDAYVLSGIDAANSITVPESIQGTEEGVVGKERWEEIRCLKPDGQSISAIARQLGLDRKTVRSCLRQASWMRYRREAAAQTLLTPHLE